MKINIVYNLTEGPYGGGNQFLKALKNDLMELGLYVENPQEADVFLFNSYHNLKDVLALKKKYPQKIFIHRLGPVFYLHRGKRWKLVDKALLAFSQKISDGFVFQSAWALQEANHLGFRAPEGKVKIILNWPDKNIFYPPKQKFVPQGGANKTKLITTSWSANLNKGFALYKFLDENLDFTRYEMVFLGNLPAGFALKNIRYVQALPSKEVADYLRANDIFIFAGRNEACSNVLIEAIACGLRIVVLNSASNKELASGAGELFENESDALSKIDLVSQNYFNYKPIILSSVRNYLDFFEQIISKKKEAPVKTKNSGADISFSFLKFNFFNLLCRILK